VVSSFLELFKNQDSIPVGVMLEPFVQVLFEKVTTTKPAVSPMAPPQNRPKSLPGFLTTVEFQLITYVTGHQKISEKVAYQMLDLLIYVYLNRPFLGNVCKVALMQVITQFKDDLEIRSLVNESLIYQALSQILGLKKEEQKNDTASPFATPSRTSSHHLQKRAGSVTRVQLNLKGKPVVKKLTKQ